MRTPYAVAAVVCAVVGVGVVALREPHTARTGGPIRIARPAVPREIRADFWFAALGVMASWSVLGVLLSLYPALAAQQTHVHNLVFGGAVVGTTAFAAAVAQMFSTRMLARRAAIAGDVGMAVALVLTVPNVVPADRRGETMSAYYLLAYTAMAVPTLVAGWAATRWALSAVFPWFAGGTAVACLVAAAVGAASTHART
jgi:hypothetical protein